LAVTNQPATYRVELSPAASRQLRRLDAAGRGRMLAVIELLATNPRPPAARAMTGQPAGTFRVRTGDYRVIYEVHDDRLLVLVLAAGHRRSICRMF
jgi:mRNA interferase RelE/StbE